MTRAPQAQRRVPDTRQRLLAFGCWPLLAFGMADGGLQALCLSGFLAVTHAQAQSAYQCDNRFSTDILCAQGKAHAVPLNGVSAQVIPAHSGLAQPMQSEAERLEKARQREAHAWSAPALPKAHASKTAVGQPKAPQERADEHHPRRKSLFTRENFTARVKTQKHKASGE